MVGEPEEVGDPVFEDGDLVLVDPAFFSTGHERPTLGLVICKGWRMEALSPDPKKAHRFVQTRNHRFPIAYGYKPDVYTVFVDATMVGIHPSHLTRVY